jgi:hypothetical protein
MSGEPLRFEASTREHAESLRGALDEFPASVVDVDGSYQVELTPHDDVTDRMVELVETVSAWLSAMNIATCQIHFGGRSLALVAPSDGGKADPTQFLVERTRQLQTALDTRIVIEQAKGILAERFRLEMDDSFELLRRSARSHRVDIHSLADKVVNTHATPSEIRLPR